MSLNPFDDYFSLSKVTALTAAAEVLTVQHPATAKKSVRFISALIFSTVAATVALERNGTAATSTAQAPVACNPADVNVSTVEASGFNTSNVGTGTVINTYQIAANTYYQIDLSLFQLPAGVADNLTLRTNSITGTVNLQILFREL